MKFWSKVDKNSANGCWLWTGAKVRGYGKLKLAGKTMRAHRVSYELAHGHIADGMDVLHKCDVPACVNPDHLFLGTDVENMADACAKGRKGQKLTAEDVLAIRADQSKQKDIARRYGIRQDMVSRIKSGHYWKHVSKDCRETGPLLQRKLDEQRASR